MVCLAVFAALISALGSSAHAKSVPACAGNNLMEVLKREKPMDYKAILDEGRAEANGNALLWKIEKPGVPASWLFGTMHLTDERLIDVPDEVLNALNGAATVAVENVDVMDPSVSKRQIGRASCRERV